MTEGQLKAVIAAVLGVVAAAIVAAPFDPGLKPVQVALAGLLTAIATYINSSALASRFARR